MFRRMTAERFLSDGELARFMAAVRERRHVHQPRDYAFFALLANTGIRPAEALALRRQDLHLSATPPWMRVNRVKKKRVSADAIQLPHDLARVLEAHLKRNADEAVFRITRRQAQRLFHRYAALAQLPVHHHLYVLRHTAGTRIYRATRDIKVVQALLGHEHPDTSSIYAHIPADLLLELAGTFPVAV